VSSQSPYSAAKHATFLDQHFSMAQTTVRQFNLKKMSQKTALTRIGHLMGHCRNVQNLLNKSLEQLEKNQGLRTLKLMLAHNLLESYLIAATLAIDGDSEAELVTRSLELRLMKLLPSFKK
jgi:hypothetical protein